MSIQKKIDRGPHRSYIGLKRAFSLKGPDRNVVGTAPTNAALTVTWRLHLCFHGRHLHLHAPAAQDQIAHVNPLEVRYTSYQVANTDQTENNKEGLHGENVPSSRKVPLPARRLVILRHGWTGIFYYPPRSSHT